MCVTVIFRIPQTNTLKTILVLLHTSKKYSTYVDAVPSGSLLFPAISSVIAIVCTF